MNCPHCNAPLTPEEIKRLWASYCGSQATENKRQASRENGKKGGRPRIKKGEAWK